MSQQPSMGASSAPPAAASMPGPASTTGTGGVPRERLSVATKAAYGLGSIAYGIKDAAFKSFLLIYYNQVIGLPSQLVASAILLALVADSLLDPLIGHASDNLRSRWGRRHPFMYFSAIPTAGAFLLLFMPPEGWSHAAMFWYIFGVAVLVRSFMAMYEIPSSALAPELSPDYDERTSIMAYRYAFAIVAGVLLYVVTLKVFLAPTPDFPHGQLNPLGWWHYAVTAAALIVVTILVSAAGTHKRIPQLRQPPRQPSRPVGAVLREVGQTLKHRSFLALMGYGVIKFTATGTTAALTLYFATYYWRLTSSQTAVLVLDSLFAALIALPLAPRLTKRFGKKPSAVALLIITVVTNLTPYALNMAGVLPPAGSNALVTILFGFQLVTSVTGVTSMILVASMLADVIEDSAVRTGRRSEGLFFAANSIVQKCVSGVGVFVGGWLLALAGFPEGARPGQVDPAILDRLVLLYMPAIVLLYGGGLLCLIGYRISRDVHTQNLATLADRPAEYPEPPIKQPIAGTPVGPLANA